jgi:hypothetical protein
MDAEPSLTEHLRTLEESLANPTVRRSPAELAQWLADDFREFGSSGRAWNKQQIIDALQAQAQVQLSLTDFRAVMLSPDVALVTYRGKAQFAPPSKPKHSLRSSIWRRQNGQWQVIFHQGTPTEETRNAVGQ